MNGWLPVRNWKRHSVKKEVENDEGAMVESWRINECRKRWK